MTRGAGSIIRKKGTSLLYIIYYATGSNGKRVQREESTGSSDPEVARKILAARVAVEQCPPTQRNPAPIAEDAEPLYLIDIPEAARRMSSTTFAIRELIRSGKLKFVMLGQKHLISPAAIQYFIRANEKFYGTE